MMNRSSLVSLYTDLPGQFDRSLLTLGVAQLGGAPLQALGLLGGERKLETFVLRDFITFHFGQLDRSVLTFLLWNWVSNCYSGLSRVHNRYIVANLILDTLAIPLMSIPSILLLRAHLLSLLFTLCLVLHLHSGGLSLLLLLVVHVVAHLIVHQLLCLCTHSPHNLYTVFLGIDRACLHLHLLTVPLYGGGAYLCVEFYFLHMTLLISNSSSMI